MRATRVGEIQDRFWQRVDKGGPEDCWNWTGTKIKDGYGIIAGPLYGKRYMEKGRNMLAHRASWIMANGDIPESSEYHGWVVMHKCDNPSCVNPSHLILGTQRQNVHDMITKKRDVRVSPIGTKSKRAKLTDAQVADIRASAVGGVKLADKYNVHISTIARARYGFGYAEGEEAANLQAGPRVRTGRKGGDNPYAKLTDDLVREIRISDLSAEKWAARLSVHPETLRDARIGKTFKHIPMPEKCPDMVGLEWLMNHAAASESTSANRMTPEQANEWISSGALAVDDSGQVRRDDVIRLMRFGRMKIPHYLK